MGYAILDSNGNAVAWSKWDNPPRPLNEGETVVESESLESAKPQSQLDAEAHADAISEIKGRASRDILLMAPTWEQRNAIARTLEIVTDILLVLVDELIEKLAIESVPSEATKAELATYRNLWDQIKQRREQSDDEENAL